MSDLRWRDLDELEADIPEEAWESMSDVIRRVNESIADQMEENRKREQRDFAAVQNLIVGNELPR